MSATLQQLLEHLYSVVITDPDSVAVLSLEHALGNVQWRVQDYRLEVLAPHPLSVDLREHTIAGLADWFRAQPGFAVAYASFDHAGLGARCLLDGAGAVGVLHAPQSLLWAYLRGAADELDTASAEIATMLVQMSVKSAGGEWLDHLCRDYYNIPREAGEADGQYSERTIAEVLMPRNNNVAIASALHRVWPAFDFRITDAPMTIKGAHRVLHDGRYHYTGTPTRVGIDGIKGYNEFDARIDVDLLLFQFTPAMRGLVAQVRAVVEKFRAAGTRLREVNFHGALRDEFDTAEDGPAVLVGAPQYRDTYYRGGHLHDGKARRCGTTPARFDGQHTRAGGIGRRGFVSDGSPGIRFNTGHDPLAQALDWQPRDTFGRPYFHDGTMMRAAFTRYEGFIARTADMKVAMPKPWHFDGAIRREGNWSRSGYRQRFIERLFITTGPSGLHDGTRAHNQFRRKDGSGRYHRMGREIEHPLYYDGARRWHEEIHDSDRYDWLPAPEGGHDATDILTSTDGDVQSQVGLQLADDLGQPWRMDARAGRSGAATRCGRITQRQVLSSPMLDRASGTGQGYRLRYSGALLRDGTALRRGYVTDVQWAQGAAPVRLALQYNGTRTRAAGNLLRFGYQSHSYPEPERRLLALDDHSAERQYVTGAERLTIDLWRGGQRGGTAMHDGGPSFARQHLGRETVPDFHAHNAPSAQIVLPVALHDGLSASEATMLTLARRGHTTQDTLDGGLLMDHPSDTYQRRLSYNASAGRTGQHQRTGLAAEGAQDGLGLTITRHHSDGSGVLWQTQIHI